MIAILVIAGAIVYTAAGGGPKTLCVAAA